MILFVAELIEQSTYVYSWPMASEQSIAWCEKQKGTITMHNIWIMME